MKHLRPYFKALCDDHRLEIITFLLDREHCLYELVEKLGLSQATVSYHAKKLNELGLIKCRYSGRSTCYSLDKEGFRNYFAYLEEKLFKPVEEATPQEHSGFCKL